MKVNQAGFGCAGLMGALSRRESLALLEAAWDAGVRHFDVAPMYGHGETEKLLGTFLRGRRDRVTLVTKFGIEPTGHSPLVELVRAIARPLARKIPALRGGRKTGGVPAPPSPEPARPPLTAESAQRSLERSLRALQTDCIDILLVHEPRTELLTDGGLPRFLEDSVRKGTIRQFGVGGDSRHLRAVFQSQPVYCPVVQCGWSVLDFPPPSFPGSQLIVFGILSGLGGKSDLAPAALRAAALALPESVILFSSRRGAHVTASARAISDASLDSAARQLLKNVGEAG